MLKRNKKYAFIIMDENDMLVDFIQLEGYRDTAVLEYLKKRFPSNYEKMTYQLVTDSELFVSFKSNQHRLQAIETQRYYAKLLQSSTNIEAHENYDSTILLNYLDNLKQSDLLDIITDSTISLFNLFTNMFLDGSNNNVIWQTVIGVLSDIAEELQKDVKVLRQEKISEEVKKACVYDIITYFEIVSGLYKITIEHGIYNAKFLDFIINAKPYLEKIITVKSNRP